MRPQILNPLFRLLSDIKGIGPKLGTLLARLGLQRVVDLAFHLPTGLLVRKTVRSLAEANVGEHVIITLTAQNYRDGRSPRAPFAVEAVDSQGDYIRLVYFGRTAKMARGLFPLGEARRVAGRLDRYGDGLQIAHPDQVGDITHPIAASESIYRLTQGLSNARMIQFVKTVLADCPKLEEWIDESFRTAQGWSTWQSALIQAHVNPQDELARDRLAYDEILANQVALSLLRAHLRVPRGIPLVGDGRLVRALSLPFEMTSAQHRVVAEITADMAQPTPMLRMLQGDVGSGKTLVALQAMLTAIEAGKQAALLAPTEILVRQHLATLQSLCTGLAVEIAALTGRDKGKSRESILMGLADGSIDIIVGTHAIFQQGLAYKDLALVIVDEQHRFGVAQRLMLTSKAKSPPHLLVMTATPIPRTLQLAHHGEMDLSILDELPPGRTPIDTRVLSLNRLEVVVDSLGRHIKQGRQAYWVCPLVSESTIGKLTAAEDRAAMLRLRFGDDKIMLIHGRMKPAEKDKAMAQFQSGAVSVLVATTVVEVGVDVPAASLMIIEHAEHFGLAQLHQLRGRVGRGAERSACLLLRSAELSDSARKRLAMMRESNDGFAIAEADLKLRGGGELLGLRQSGEAGYKIATAEHIERLLPIAHKDARLFVTRDGGLAGKRGAAMRQCLYLFERDTAVPLLRSG